MKHSESLIHLAPALVKAQAQVKPAFKDSANPFFKSKYADFSSILDACEDALTANGIAVVQSPVSTEAGIGVETMLLHSSGEWITGELVLPVSKADAQGGGSCITYARRYALEGFLRIRREDDDGNAAATSSRVLREKGLAILEAALPQGMPGLEAAWKALSNDMRGACKLDLPALKEKANKEKANKEKSSHATVVN